MSVQRSARLLALVLIATGMIMGGVALASAWRDIPTTFLTGDPAAITDEAFYLGAVTMLRTATLAGAAAVCLVAARIIRGGDRALGEFLGVLGLFAVVLVLDDQFQGHEAVLNGILGVPEPLTFAVYGAVALAGTVRHRRTVRRLPEAPVLIAAFALLAVAAGADTFRNAVLSSFVEASAELAGILCLAFFGLRVSVTALRAATAGRDSSIVRARSGDPTVADVAPRGDLMSTAGERPDVPAG